MISRSAETREGSAPPIPSGEPLVTPAGPRLTIGHAAVLGLATSAASVLLSVARSKVTATVLGPSGIGLSAEVQQLVALGMVPVSMITGPALVTALAELRRRQDVVAADRILGTALSLVLLVSGLASLLAFGLGFWFLPTGSMSTSWPLIVLAGFSATLGNLVALPSQVLIAFERLRSLTLLGITGNGLTTVLVIIGTVAGGLTGQFVGAALGALFTLPIAVWITTKEATLDSWRVGPAFDREFARRCWHVGLTTLTAGLALQGALFTIRVGLERHGGAVLNGYFQAAWAIGMTYFQLVLSALGNFAFPRYAAAERNELLQAEIDAAAAFVTRTAPPLILLALAVRRPMIQLVYSHQFDPSIDLLGLMMAGDLPRALAWVYGGSLLYKSRLGAFALCEAAAAGGLALLSAFLIPYYGVMGVGIAYSLNALLAVIANVLVVAFVCAVPVAWARLAHVGGVMAILLFGTWLSSYALGAVLCAATAVIWAASNGLLGSMIAHSRFWLNRAASEAAIWARRASLQ